jgi:hypothetical protein
LHPTEKNARKETQYFLHINNNELFLDFLKIGIFFEMKRGQKKIAQLKKLNDCEKYSKC